METGLVEILSWEDHPGLSVPTRCDPSYCCEKSLGPLAVFCLCFESRLYFNNTVRLIFRLGGLLWKVEDQRPLGDMGKGVLKFLRHPSGRRLATSPPRLFPSGAFGDDMLSPSLNSPSRPKK